MVCNCTQYGRKYGEKHNVFSPLFGSWSGSHHWPHLSVLSSSSVPSNDMASQGTEAHKASQGIRQLYGLQNPLLRVLNICDLATTYHGSCCPAGRVPCLQRGPGCPPVGCCSGLGCGSTGAAVLPPLQKQSLYGDISSGGLEKNSDMLVWSINLVKHMAPRIFLYFQESICNFFCAPVKHLKEKAQVNWESFMCSETDWGHLNKQVSVVRVLIQTMCQELF